jgi:hypothetical protein
MDQAEDSRGPSAGRPRWAGRVLAGTRAGILLLVGGLAGSATFERSEREIVLVDLYWKDGFAEVLRFVGTTSIDVAAGEEFRVKGDFGREAVLLFCSPRSERNPCGAEGAGPKTAPEPDGDYPSREPDARGRKSV